MTFHYATLFSCILLVPVGASAQADTLAVRVRHVDCDVRTTLHHMRTLPVRTAVIKAHDGEEATYEGAWIKDVLHLDCASIKAIEKRTMVRSYVRIAAADGYSALVALTEADSSFRAHPVLLAWKKNGEPLDDHNGPFQLIVPDDMRHARDVRQVAVLEVVTP